MAERIIAIGDIHGCLEALEALLRRIGPRPDDVFITLGDTIDRGPDSRGVIQRLIGLGRSSQLVPILGNHDELLLRILDGEHFLLDYWLGFGGDATLASYGVEHPDDVPVEHVDFLRACRPLLELPHAFFVHASYVANRSLRRQPPEALRWVSLADGIPKPHRSGKTCFCGHTSQKSGEILDLGYLKCLDTWVYGQGCLTAMDIRNGEIWQADKEGNLR